MSLFSDLRRLLLWLGTNWIELNCTEFSKWLNIVYYPLYSTKNKKKKIVQKFHVQPNSRRLSSSLIFSHSSVAFLLCVFILFLVYLSLVLEIFWVPCVIQSADSVCVRASQLLRCDWNIRPWGRRTGEGLGPDAASQRQVWSYPEPDSHTQ